MHVDPEAVWYGRHPLALVLAPLGWLYCGIARLRRAAYRRGLLTAYRSPAPVVVVGNLTVGGTGKTPLVLLIAQAAIERGWRPAIITRGYRGAARDWPRLVAPDDDPALVGDEPAMMAARRICPVIAGPDRAADARLALAGQRADLLICDDGLQHYRLARDLELAVIDARRGLGNRRCLPAGPLREPPGRLREVDLVVINGESGSEGEVGFTLRPGDARSLARPGQTKPLAAFAGTRVTAVAGIGNPGRFFEMLAGYGIEIDSRAYPDHHGFSASDLADWPHGPVLMTEKDGVKCASFAGADHWVCPVDAVPDPGLIPDLFAILEAKTPSRF